MFKSASPLVGEREGITHCDPGPEGIGCREIMVERSRKNKRDSANTLAKSLPKEDPLFCIYSFIRPSTHPSIHSSQPTLTKN